MEVAWCAERGTQHRKMKTSPIGGVLASRRYGSRRRTGVDAAIVPVRAPLRADVHSICSVSNRRPRDARLSSSVICRLARRVKGAHRVPIPLYRLCQYAGNRANRSPFAPALSIDMESGGAVLEFTYRFLKAHSRPPSDDEVRNVTWTIANYKGCRFVSQAALESYLACLYDTGRV